MKLLSPIIMFIYSFIFLNTIKAQPPIRPLNSVTWNMQGATCNGDSKWGAFVRAILACQDNQVLALQEAGKLPSTAIITTDMARPLWTPVNGNIDPRLEEYRWNSGTATRNQDIVYIYHYYIANRVSLAIVSRTRATNMIVFPQLAGGTRPVIGIQIGNSYYFNMHARARANNESPNQVLAIELYMANILILNNNANWLIMGDFNQNPDNLQNILGLPPQGVTREILRTGLTTQVNAGEIDYAVAGRSSVMFPVMQLLNALRIVLTQFSSDHLPVYFRSF